MHSVLVGVSVGMLLLIVVCLVVFLLIPKFEEWLDQWKYQAEDSEGFEE